MKKVAFYTLGCKLNYSESSSIGRMFEDKGYTKVEFNENPDIFIINTCSVTENADKKCRKIVREAQMFAQRTVDRANDEAARLRNEAEDYCDQKLAQFEIVLQRTLKTVHVGREKLQVTPLPEARAGDIDYSADAETTVFDQDLDA